MAEKQDLANLFKNARELMVPETVQVEGKVPSYVHGNYLRVGPGKYHFENGFSMKHFFDGYSCVSQFDIRNGSEVSFRNKLLDTDVIKRANAAQKPVVCEFGTGACADPNKGWFARCIPHVIPEMSDNANMTLYQIGSNVCVAGESCFFHDLNKVTMELGDKHDTNKCYGLNFVSPHLLTDKDGATYTVGSSFLTGLKYNFVRIPPMTGKPCTKEILKKSQVIASISSQMTTMLSMHHSFGMTENYLVFVEQPYVLNVTKILGGVLTKGQCFMDWLEWRGELRNRFYIIHKETGKVHKAEVVTKDPFMFTHFINCYEEEGHIVADIMCFENGDFFEYNILNYLLEKTPVRESDYGRAERFVFPILDSLNGIEEGKELVSLQYTTASAVKDGKKLVLTPEVLTNRGLELPCLNRSFVGMKYRFFYSTGTISPPGYYENSLVKMNLESKEVLVWKGSEDSNPGEPVFIRNPEANEEDEDNGVIVSAICSSKKEEKGCLVFLDAKTFKEIGRARFESEVPYLIHGIFLPNA